MNQLLLTPTDVLFFRDGRPMNGSLSGHGAAWPLPTITNAALHAALWNAGLDQEAHQHRRNADPSARTERFGSLVTAGPFPVGPNSDWYFPKPADADLLGSGVEKLRPILQPSEPIQGSGNHLSLPFPVASLIPPSKEKPKAWWNRAAWDKYLGASPSPTENQPADLSDAEFTDAEAMIGIGIDPETQSQDGKSIYSAQYLRLKPGFKLGVLAETAEKTELRGERADLVERLIERSGSILVGGQQRVCTAEIIKADSTRSLPLPAGKSSGFEKVLIGGRESYLVKWVLLSPAIWPEITTGSDKEGKPIQHTGGWLPNWIRHDTLEIMLPRPIAPRDPATISRDAYRKLVAQSGTIRARLVSAIVPKPISVTGWSLGAGDDNGATPERKAGARPSHLAVPAGAVYYFFCDSQEDATQLASALNWHGDGNGSRVLRRRSTLFGEKGFGLGVCGTWSLLNSTTSV